MRLFLVCLNELNWGSRACALLLLFAVTAIVSPAQTFTSLFSFGGASNGSWPQGPLVEAFNGNFYGTAYDGGGGSDNGHGIIFNATPAGKVESQFTFNGNGVDGTYPRAGLVLDGANNTFYGTTSEGGTRGGYGTIFGFNPYGTFTVLRSFSGTDGADPLAALVADTGGNLYGTTSSGGAYGFGTIFRITPTGKFATLYNFCSQSDCTDGSIPLTALIQATDGNFYGTTSQGGEYNSGTVFEITAGGALTTLYSFENAPSSGLMQATNGNFYGATGYGGTAAEGTVFEMTISGGVATVTTLYSFCAQTNCPDGEDPSGNLMQANDGNLYGATYSGGTSNDGTIFQFDLSTNTLTTLHSFEGTDGANPEGLVQGTNGSIYGTTSAGGLGDGTFFSLSVPGLRPFVETVPTSGKVGSNPIIIGSNLTGATSVTFNGTAAAFEVVSTTEIGTTVPTGATTGKVHVTTPRGTLTSNVNFRVVP